MDDSAIRAGKLAGLLLLAAGFSGCVAASYSRGPGRVSIVASAEAPAADCCAATDVVANDLQTAEFETANPNGVRPATLELEIPELPPILPRRTIEVPFEPEPQANVEPRRLQTVLPRDSAWRKVRTAPRRAQAQSRVPRAPLISEEAVVDEEAPGKAFVCSDTELGGATDVLIADDAAVDDDPPGRAFVCDVEPVVVYQELPVAVPAEHWPGHSSSGGGEGPRSADTDKSRRRNAVKRPAAGHDAANSGIVRYVDPAQGIAQVVFSGMTLVEPGTRIAVKHQILFGKLASTEVLEVVSSEPGAALVRPIGAGRIAKTSIGDPAVIMAR